MTQTAPPLLNFPVSTEHRACPRRDSASDHRSPKEIRTFDRDAGAVCCRAVELVARDALTRGTLTTWATSSATMANRSKGCTPSAARVATRRSALNSSLSTRRSVTSLATPYTTASLAIFPGPARRRQTPRWEAAPQLRPPLHRRRIGYQHPSGRGPSQRFLQHRARAHWLIEVNSKFLSPHASALHARLVLDGQPPSRPRRPSGRPLCRGSLSATEQVARCQTAMLAGSRPGSTHC